MKKSLLLAGGLLLAASTSYAGGLSDTIVEMAPPAPVEPVMEESSGSIPGWVIPLAIIGIMLGVAASGDDDEGDEREEIRIDRF